MNEDEGNIDLSDYVLETKSGKFYLNSNRNKHILIEVTEDVFKSRLVSASNALQAADKTQERNYKRLQNILDAMLNQLTEDSAFNLKMMSNSWTYSIKGTYK